MKVGRRNEMMWSGKRTDEKVDSTVFIPFCRPSLQATHGPLQSTNPSLFYSEVRTLHTTALHRINKSTLAIASVSRRQANMFLVPVHPWRIREWWGKVSK